MWLILYILSPISIPQRTQSLIKIIVSRTQISYHHRLSIPSQRILQQPSQLRIPIRNMWWLRIHQCTYHIPQWCQWLIYINSLLKSISHRLSLTLSLTPSQIHQIQLTHSKLSISIYLLRYLHNHWKYTMRSRTISIHLCLTLMSILTPLYQFLG